ncbi:MAG: T9SS type A sorting domain-containing protein, partial [Hymenobacter sp.]
GRLDYRPVGSAAWRIITANADLSQHTYTWTAPDTASLVQLRCVVGGQEYVSDTVVLARPLAVRVGYVCPEEALLTWAATPGATQYRVYRLGATAPELFQTTADTLLRVLPAQPVGQYVAVAPVLGGRVAERGPTASLAEGGVGCYIRSFLPVPAVTDTVRLQLMLGSLYRLRSVQLQRLGPAGFTTIQTVLPVASLTTLFTDLAAVPGANQYRILGQDVDGRTFYSPTETVQLVRRQELLVYPVPVVTGQDLLVAGEPGVAFSLALYDALGRLLRTSAGTAAINFFPTDGLRPGVYLLRATPATGAAPLTRRVVVE